MKNAEARIQAGIVEYIRTVAIDVKVWAVPNGGLRTKAEAALLKWTGALAGIPDLELAAANGFHVYIEVKTPDGRLSPEQADFRDWCARAGHNWELARSIDDARAILARYQIRTREAA